MNSSKSNSKGEEQAVPEIMIDGAQALELVARLQKENTPSAQNQDLSRYLVMEGMQNETKVPFFTELTNDDDVLRMNTIEAYVNIAPLIIRKTSEKNFEKINKLLDNVYTAHVKGHKRNMVSKGRAREQAYVKILASGIEDTYNSSGLQKFFGVGGGKKR